MSYRRRMDAPDPLLPESSLVPTFLTIGLLLLIVAVSVFHAVQRKRVAWIVGMVVLPPVAVIAYWLVELLRPSGWTKARRASE